MCELQRGEAHYDDALAAAEEARKLDASWPKACYRMAAARLALKRCATRVLPLSSTWRWFLAHLLAARAARGCGACRVGRSPDGQQQRGIKGDPAEGGRPRKRGARAVQSATVHRHHRRPERPWSNSHVALRNPRGAYRNTAAANLGVFKREQGEGTRGEDGGKKPSHSASSPRC